MGGAGGRDKVIGDRFRREKANSSSVPETVGTAFREGRKKEFAARRSGRIPAAMRRGPIGSRDGGASHRLAALIIWYGSPGSTEDYHCLPAYLYLLRRSTSYPQEVAAARLYPIPSNHLIIIPTYRYACVTRYRMTEISPSTRSRSRG